MSSWCAVADLIAEVANSRLELSRSSYSLVVGTDVTSLAPDWVVTDAQRGSNERRSNGQTIIAVAVAHATQCPYCIRGHTAAAVRTRATPEEIMEAIWVAVEMRAGGAYAHSILALDTIAELQAAQGIGGAK